MESISDNTPLIVIVGQTASGKSALALRLAQQYNGEIVAADSRTVYRGMDIGTAKPTTEEQRLVRHHLLDIADPGQQFTVADFQRLAGQAITDIADRGHVPFLVGGSGLYVDAVLYNFSLRPLADPFERERLERLSVEELQDELAEQQIPLPFNSQNKRHLIRTLETKGQLPQKGQLRPNTLVIGVSRERDMLEQDITRRVDAMLEAGFVDEVRRLSDRYGWDAPGLQAPGYRAFRSYVEGDSSIEEARQQFIQNDLRYAKRQKTWFKRNPDIHWISNPEGSVDLVTTFLNKGYIA